MADKGFREVDKPTEAFISNEEGRIPYVYDDAIYPTRKYVKGTKIKGNLTGGVGHLLSRGSKIFPEAHAWIGKTIPATVIDQWLDDDLDVAEKAADKLIKVNLNDHQFGAVISFIFNVGVGAFQKSGLLKKLNAGNFNAVPAEFNKWTKTTINNVKVTSKGLVARRAHEVAYFLGGPAPKNTTTKMEPKATEIAEPQVKKWTPEEILGAGGTVATVTAAGFATEGFLSYVFGGILILAVLGVIFVFVKRQFFPR